jgi:hypothetical protein
MHSGWDWDGIVRVGLPCLPNHLLQVSTPMGTKIETSEGRTDSDHETVLVDVVKFVEDPELVSPPSLIWFGRIDCVYGVLPHALYFSSALGFIFRGRSPTNREVDRVVGRVPAGPGQQKSVGQMVESASEGLNDIPSYDRNARRHVYNAHDTVDQLSCLWIAFGSHFVWFGVEEGFDSSIEIGEVLFGTVDFEPRR